MEKLTEEQLVAFIRKNKNNLAKTRYSPKTDKINMWQLLDILEKNKITRYSNAWSMLCPFHEEKTPSFVIVPLEGTYNCFGCGKDGYIEEIAFLLRSKDSDKINKPIEDFDPWKEIMKDIEQEPTEKGNVVYLPEQNK